MDKNTMRWIAKAAFWTVAIGLFVYAASRSLDFIQQTLPPSQMAVGYLALLATGGGAVSWLAVFLFYAQGSGQKGLALVLVVVDLLFEIALFTADTLLRAGQNDLVVALTEGEILLVIYAMSAAIAVNVLASFLFHILNPETAKRMREASAKDALDQAVLKNIEQKAPVIAEQLAPQIALEWEQDFMRRFDNMHALGLGSIQPSNNGRKPEKVYNAEAEGVLANPIETE